MSKKLNEFEVGDTVTVRPNDYENRFEVQGDNKMFIEGDLYYEIKVTKRFIIKSQLVQL